MKSTIFNLNKKPKSFYFTLPGHLKSFNLKKDSTGYMITFSEKFLRQFHGGDLYKEFPFLLAETVPVMYPPQEIFHDPRLLYESIHRQYEAKSEYKYPIIGNLLFDAFPEGAFAGQRYAEQQMAVVVN